MKQVVQSPHSGERRLADLANPTCSSDGLLIQTRRSLLFPAFEARVRANSNPQAQSAEDEFACGLVALGEVVETGRLVNNFQPGERVVAIGLGVATHAERNDVPASFCASVPAEVGDTEACFAGLGAYVLESLRVLELRLGERVAVLGLDPCGLMAVDLLKAQGCEVFAVDDESGRRQLAEQLGADHALAFADLERCQALSDAHGMDAVLIADHQGEHPLKTAAEIAGQRARISSISAIESGNLGAEFHRKQLSFRPSCSFGPGQEDPAYRQAGSDYPFAYVRFTLQRNLETVLYLMGSSLLSPRVYTGGSLPLSSATRAYAVAGPRDLPIVLEYSVANSIAKVSVDQGAASKATRHPHAAQSELNVACLASCEFADSRLLPALSEYRSVQVSRVQHDQALAGDRDTEALMIPAELVREDASEAHALIVSALAEGKHVYLEQAPCFSNEESEALEVALAQAREHNLYPCYTVGYRRRFSPHVELLRDGFAQRSTPMVISYRAHGRGGSSGDLLAPELFHYVDLCLHLVNQPLIRVHCQRPEGDDAATIVSLHFADGSLANIQHLACGSPDMPSERIEVFAGGESGVCDDFGYSELFGAGKSLRKKGADGHAESLAAFLTTCRSGGAWPIAWSELRATQVAHEAAAASLTSGRSVQLRRPSTQTPEVGKAEQVA